MKKARGTRDPLQLCSGPGKLTMALGVTGGHHGKDLCADPGFSFSTGRTRQEVAISPRVGISRAAGLPWRFYAAGNPHVSHSYFVKVGRDGNSARPRN
jgi:DNA-3-methyladenine glycosylase